MLKLSRAERRASELDTTDLPVSKEILDWIHFNSDFKSTDKSFDSVKSIALAHEDERMDLRPYMIESPFVCTTTDKFQKVLDIFRANQLRQICVINPVDGSLQGVISREDIFAYMSL
uniref:CBS domain-containing protein n=1 Tax=Strombidium inclinatum TaxID=197538 RepID=A0A7S3N344_9SPIT|mmetsp:Transcript_5755/g.9159  ORF Transcript_5755/g.9159 Transcript_5755/m.9159 type:complete len:117 (+) Transcript_5755:2446-2796(+)